ncbi:putative ATP-binding cassette transporter [Azospirillum agricola]|uniref:cyclic peptide export ABC transporter n=1 Tax=Azospirillum agricola TaxID=1720247 RepID=UPI001AE252CC|nr:cyclic peptide export ABC transporter [Azospirillum agricola]MBP2229020.1 putative ATP-binding cassette transporter [Azospirillum agricola]
MDLYRFLIERSRSSQRAVIALVLLSGLSSGLMLSVVNTAAEMASNGKVELRIVVLFAAALALFVVSKRKSMTDASVAAERAICDIRIEMAEKLRRSELLFVEHTGHGDIYARLTQDTSTISQSMPVIFNGLQSLVIVLAGLGYVLTISLDAFLMTLAFLMAAAWSFLQRQRTTMRDLEVAVAKETEFFDALGHLVDGFKEVKINHRKNDDVFDRISHVARETEAIMVRVVRRYTNHLVVSQTLIYLILAVLVFVLPSLEWSKPETIMKLTAAVLFLVAPLENVQFASHFHMKAQVSLRSIQALERSLDRALDREDLAADPDPARFADFRTLELRNVVFRYPGNEHTFQIGPLNLTIERGQTTFIVGGNGCGKSTLLKVLTGLYQPQSGRIVIDGQDVAPAALPSYRELFGCIFADFHLFDRLYGLEGTDPARINALIADMGLGGKTEYRDGRFTNLDLSTGQRKRLALIAALLEDKPIHVFDEWAADQDPEFRARFYDVILPGLRAEGKTIIAVTHDDRYFGQCQQLVKLDYGEFVAMEHPQAG